MRVRANPKPDPSPKPSPSPNLASEEEEHVARRLGEVDLHDGDERGVEVVRLGSLGVEDLDGEGAPGDGEDGAPG